MLDIANALSEALAIASTFRIRAEQAEAALAGIADVLNQELRENGGDRSQVNGIGEDMRPAIRALVDCVNRRTEAERDALHTERDGLLRVSGAQVEMYHHLETTLQEARGLLEEATHFTDETGIPMRMVTLDRVLAFLSRTAPKERGENKE